MKTGQPISAADGLHSVEVPVITRQSSLTGVFLTTTRSILHVMHLKREKKARRPFSASCRYERRTHMLIAEIQKNTRERIRISIEEYRGHRLIDCRVYYEDDQGEWRPTKKGIALNNETIDEVANALNKAKSHLANK